MADYATTIYAGAQPSINPIDTYRCAITHTLSLVSGVSPELIYPALQWQSTLVAGDLVLAVPRLRIKGQQPDILAQEWASKFPKHDLLCQTEAEGIYVRFRFSPEQAGTTILPTIQQRVMA